MPAFMDPSTGQKRSSDAHDAGGARKRQAVDAPLVETYWMVQWRVKQTKKHKTWDGDAVLVLTGTDARLVDTDGRLMNTGRVFVEVSEGAEFELGGKTLEVDRRIPRGEYVSGACFGRGPSIAGPSTPLPRVAGSLSKKFTPLLMNPNPRLPASAQSMGSPAPRGRGVELEAVSLVASDSSSATPSKSTIPDSAWSVHWRKPQSRKHKTWDGDAFVHCSNGMFKLISESGKLLGTSKARMPPYAGALERIGPREVEFDEKILVMLLPRLAGVAEDADAPFGAADDEWEVPVPRVGVHSPVRPPAPTPAPALESPAVTSSAFSAKKFVPPVAVSFYSKPLEKAKAKGPLHDPDAEGAIVMKAPTKEALRKFNAKNQPIVPVVLDPLLARKLRPHQIEGVSFLYECVMGLRKHEGQGCILADEMGLGKTLQTIALVWTLLKQNPYGGTSAGGVIGKALIVCPVTLVNNWKNEFKKWLGRDRVGVFDGTKDKATVKQFINSRIHQVLIIGYEKLRTVIAELAYCNPPIGLIICDEGHRLKSANNKTSKMFEALRTPRRVILSGTPIQNDLSEFHAMADFCNPGLLDAYATFKKVYELPILRSRAPDCTPKEAELGAGRTAQLSQISKSFVLRREATILKKYLPPKTEYVVFITPTTLQHAMFDKMLRAERLDEIERGTTAESLALIGHLTKISSSPILFKATADAGRLKGARGLEETAALVPAGSQPEEVALSGKLIALAALLRMLKRDTDEKCIIVSHFTSTLNVIETYCDKKGYTFHRLDGQTPAVKRQEYVNSFNRSSQATRFVFLLSSKAGGVGLNLIGASRLVLFDSDWNPSHDLQSMARIHRDGQTRPVFIYRFLTAGAIDEKIFQRQVTKLGLSESLMGTGSGGSKSDSFTRKELRDIFRIHPDTACHTHELLDCRCDDPENDESPNDGPSATDEAVDDLDSDLDEDDMKLVKTFQAASQLKPEQMDRMDKAYAKNKKAALAALSEWTHIHCLRPNAPEYVRDPVLRKLLHASAPAPVTSTNKAKPSMSLLDAVDIDNILAMDDEQPEVGARDVPGGTISFLFERSSEAALPPESDEGEEQQEESEE